MSAAILFLRRVPTFLLAAFLCLAGGAPLAAQARAYGAPRQPPQPRREWNEVEAVTRDLQALAKERQWKYQLSDARIRQLAPLIVQEAAGAELPSALVLAVIARDSRFQPSVLAPSGAVGLMQVMPFWLPRLHHQFGGNLTDPATNLRYGTYALRDAIVGEGGDLDRGLLRFAGCRGGASAEGCGAYPREIQALAERTARESCRRAGWQSCVAEPVRAAFAVPGARATPWPWQNCPRSCPAGPAGQ